VTMTSSMGVPRTADSVSFLFLDDDGAVGAFISIRYGGPGSGEPLRGFPAASWNITLHPGKDCKVG
jgi:hypothetical protein